MILVLSGTRDGRKIIKLLLKNNHRVLATTATEYGGTLIEDHPNLTVISNPLDKSDMIDIIVNKDIKTIIDATHPYAKEVSQNAIDAFMKTKIPYLRYERSQGNYDNIIKVKSFEMAAQLLNSKEGNTLLTIGSNHLDKFSDFPDKEKLYIRVLPTTSVIEKCKTLGFVPKQILGLQGPFSKEFNRVIFNEYNIKYMVTKDSGDVGGTREKIEAAKESGVEVILVERPNIKYENEFNDIEELIIFVNKNYGCN